MIIQPKEDFRLLGMGCNFPKLDKNNHYQARLATNQPDWKEKGKVLVSFFNDSEEPSILLEEGDYNVIEL